jgi:hypothetical protein
LEQSEGLLTLSLLGLLLKGDSASATKRTVYL